MMAGPMPQFQMNPAMHQQQQMMPRMHPSQSNPVALGISTPQRNMNTAQNTPGNSMPAQAVQYPSTQTNTLPHGAPQSQSQTPNSIQPQSTPSISTPQTPTFPSTGQPGQANGASGGSTPQSPNTESREKERFAVLLDINQELLYEIVSLMNSKAEVKKAQQAEADGGGNGDVHPVDYAEEEKLLSIDYNR